jgi:hypothetical protein
MATSVPYIDPNVEHVGVSRLRTLNATNLRHFDKALVIQDNDKPLAVLLTYDQFLLMQRQLESALETVEVLTDDEERSLLADGLRAVSEGRTKPLSEIRAALHKGK